MSSSDRSGSDGPSPATPPSRTHAGSITTSIRISTPVSTILRAPSHFHKRSTSWSPLQASKGGSGGIDSTAASISNSSTGLAESVDEVPPWDRTVQVIWNKQAHYKFDKIKRDDGHNFQMNIVRLAAESAILNPDAVTPAPPNNDNGSTEATENARTRTKIQRGDVAGKDNGPYFSRLPDRVRFMITRHVVRSHDSGKVIRLNSTSCFDPIWLMKRKGTTTKGKDRFWSNEDYFDSLKTVLAELYRYTSVCFGMRVDILATLLLTRQFHVVYSPFVTEQLQPAATLYLSKYGPLMKWVTIEVDMSKLGGHWHPSAASMDMRKSLKRPRELVERFVERQLTRHHGGTTLHKLIILVRRYYGCHAPGVKGTSLGCGTAQDKEQHGKYHNDKTPVDHLASAEALSRRYRESKNSSKGKPSSGAVDASRLSQTPPDRTEDTEAQDPIKLSGNAPPPASGAVPYCSDEHLDILDPIKRLTGFVDSLCLVGTSKPCTIEIVAALCGKDRSKTNGDDIVQQQVCHYRNPSDIYPFTSGQSSAVTLGPPSSGGNIQIVRHQTESKTWMMGLNGCESVVVDEWHEHYAGRPCVKLPDTGGIPEDYHRSGALQPADNNNKKTAAVSDSTVTGNKARRSSSKRYSKSSLSNVWRGRRHSTIDSNVDVCDDGAEGRVGCGATKTGRLGGVSSGTFRMSLPVWRVHDDADDTESLLDHDGDNEPEPGPGPSTTNTNDNKWKRKSRRLFFPSRISVLIKKHMHSSPKRMNKLIKRSKKTAAAAAAATVVAVPSRRRRPFRCPSRRGPWSICPAASKRVLQGKY
ncbi:hypothetical protein B0H66DRAFT_632262 [Apodospora peruviana]|uniref:Uncharacterized protein n=1 Tax=Apodospora peruviana TaxID=516989 RepID=A0AAE0HWD1_9PEZI|nr:hypothetical protein B0H66DRAFT_632262 [Apodospora peruviana]